MTNESLEWKREWSALSAAIRGFGAAAGPFYEACKSTGSDFHGIANSYLIPRAKAIVVRLQAFGERLGLPEEAATAIRDFSSFEKHSLKGASGVYAVGAYTAALAAVEATVGLLLEDRELLGCQITERAFEHLQRQIVADPAVREAWKTAFDLGEPACEKLGAVHLLLHGVWAFKIGAAGERTDLVYNQPLDLGATMRTGPSALVLTEWKKADSASKATPCAEEAQRQAALYTTGCLADSEISRTRYLVVVTRKSRGPLDDVSEGNVRYRRLVLAVDPDSPSVEARRSENDRDEKTA